MNSVQAGLATGPKHQEWIPMLQLAATEVFELMLGSQLALADPQAPEVQPNITAMVGLAGALCGVLSVHCDDKTAGLMASKMLGVEVDKVGPDVSDAIGEVCNMVAGNFKNKISGLGDGCMLSPPTVVTGSDYNLHSLADSPGLEVHMLFESLPLVISLQVHS
jgi:chemotaxis protein CheX